MSKITGDIRRFFGFLKNHPGLSLVVRLAAAITVSWVTYIASADSQTSQDFPFTWVWRGYNTPLSAIMASAWPIFAVGMGAVVLVSFIRIKRHKPQPTLPAVGLPRLVGFAAYEELMRWCLWMFWLVVVTDLPGLFRWLFDWLLPVVNVITFGVSNDHIGGHLWTYGAAAVLAAIRFSRGPETTSKLSRLTGWYIGVMTFTVLMNGGIVYAIAIKVAYYLAVRSVRWPLRRLQSSGTT